MRTVGVSHTALAKMRVSTKPSISQQLGVYFFFCNVGIRCTGYYMLSDYYI